MSRLANPPSHLGRKVFGVIILAVIIAAIIVGVIHKTSASAPRDNAPSSSPSPPTPSTSTSPPSLPAPPAPPAVVSSCHKAIDVPAPATAEQGFVDRIWEYEAAYLSGDTITWNATMQKLATVKYQTENRRPANQTPSAILTSIIPDGSIVSWTDNATQTERTVSTIVCILIKDGTQALTLPYSVPAHYTTWIKTESGWLIDHETDQGW